VNVSVSRSVFPRLLIVLLALAILPYFLQLGASSIWDANEAFYVETPREMIESGDYINPSFNYEPRFNKPVLSYWVVAGLYQIFGVSVGVQRAAIAGAAMLMLAGTFFITRAASPDRLAPILATIGLAAGPRFFMFSRRILVDMAIAAMMTLVLLFFVLAERYPGRRRLFLILMYVCVGLGVLTKGPVAAVVPALVFLVYLGVQGELRRLREMMIPAGTLIALAIVAPWYVALYAQHGWTHITDFFIGENLGRFTETVGVQARGPFFYLPVILYDSLPWSLCLPAVIFDWNRRRRLASADVQHRIRTLLLLWIAVTVVLFSLSQTKQDLYIFSIVAAVAALGGDWLARPLDSPVRPDSRWLTATLAVLAAVLAAFGAFVLYLFAALAVYRIEGALIAGALLLGGGVALGVFAWRQRYAAAVALVLAVFIAFNWVLLIRILPSFEAYKPVVPLSEVIRRQAGADDAVTHFDVALPSMVFYLQRHIDIWFDPDAFKNQMRSTQKVLAVLPAHRYEGLKDEFGVPTCVLARHATSEIRLRNLLRFESPPEVVLITNRCGPLSAGGPAKVD
jgi:4-amino-4-deoxy-L-arabinose transferase-like glycosyltransferase